MLASAMFSSLMKLAILVLLLVLSGCAKTRWDRVESAYPGDFPENIGKTWRTPTGIAVDGEANPNEIDWVVDNVYECLKTAVPTRLTSAESRAGGCFADQGIREPFEYPKRADLVVKIGPWHPSCANPKRHVLDVEVPERYGCDPNKPPPPGCEKNACYWRGGYRRVGNRHLHVAVPELSMLADTLTRMVTACVDPYDIPRISACAKWRRL